MTEGQPQRSLKPGDIVMAMMTTTHRVIEGDVLAGLRMVPDDDLPDCQAPCWPICCEDCPFGKLGDTP